MSNTSLPLALFGTRNVMLKKNPATLLTSATIAPLNTVMLLSN